MDKNKRYKPMILQKIDKWKNYSTKPLLKKDERNNIRMNGEQLLLKHEIKSMKVESNKMYDVIGNSEN